MAIDLEHRFTLDLPLAEAWKVLTDIERIAPCVPGAQLTDVDGHRYKGSIKVRLGPITAQYKGEAVLVDADEGAHRMVIDGKGRDSFGQGNAAAQMVGTLRPEGAGTAVTIASSIQIAGKIASLGKGVMQDVSSRLLDQFVANLESSIAQERSAPPAGGAACPADATASSGGPRRIPGQEAEAVDLMALGGGAVLKRVVPGALALVAAVAGAVFFWRRRR